MNIIIKHMNEKMNGKHACININISTTSNMNIIIKHVNERMNGKCACIKAGFCCIPEKPPGTCSSLEIIVTIIIMMRLTIIVTMMMIQI